MADVESTNNHQDLLVVGELRSSCFHKAKHVAEVHITIVNTVFKLFVFFFQQVQEQTQKAVTIEPMMEFQWSMYKEHLKKVSDFGGHVRDYYYTTFLTDIEPSML